jgi:hypothetical protein
LADVEVLGVHAPGVQMAAGVDDGGDEGVGSAHPIFPKPFGSGNCQRINGVRVTALKDEFVSILSSAGATD